MKFLELAKLMLGSVVSNEDVINMYNGNRNEIMVSVPFLKQRLIQTTLLIMEFIDKHTA